MILFPYGRILAEKGDIDKNGPIHYIQYPSRRLIADTMVTGDFLLLPPPSFFSQSRPVAFERGAFFK